MGTAPEPHAVERDLATYYDQEGDDRANRALEPRRIAAREACIATLAANQRVLEIGIGPGRDAAAFVAAGHTVVGVDLSRVFAQLAMRIGAHTAIATVRALPFPDGSFDVVWSMSTLMHVPDSAIDAALGEVARVLRPDGTAVIGVWGGADVESYLQHPRFDPPRLFARRSTERWRALLATIGTVDRLDEWHEADEEFWYQWAVVRRS